MQDEGITALTDIDLFYRGSSLVVKSSHPGSSNLQSIRRPGICKHVLTSTQREWTGLIIKAEGSWPIENSIVLQGKSIKPGILSIEIIDATKKLMLAATPVLH